jgi:hypothetical protein
MRIPNPLSPQFIDDDTGATPLLLITISSLVLDTMCAPSFDITSSAARSSFDVPGFRIVVAPFDSNAAAHARCIELFDAGACTFPPTDEGFIVTTIVNYY